MKYILISTLFIAGCTNSHHRKCAYIHKIDENHETICSNYWMYECGVTLNDCMDGKRYICIKDVEEVCK